MFLSYEDVKQDVLIGFLRLRHSAKASRPEIKGLELDVVSTLNAGLGSIDIPWKLINTKLKVMPKLYNKLTNIL